MADYIFDFIRIPYAVLYDSVLSDFQKLLFGQILSLANNRNYCFATNEYLALILGKNRSTISKNISELEHHGLVKVSIGKANSRRIYVLREKLTGFIYQKHLAMLKNDKSSSDEAYEAIVEKAKNNNINEDFKKIDKKNKVDDNGHQFIPSMIKSFEKIKKEYFSHISNDENPPIVELRGFAIESMDTIDALATELNITPEQLYYYILHKKLPSLDKVGESRFDFFYSDYSSFIIQCVEEGVDSGDITPLDSPVKVDRYNEAYEYFIKDSYKKLLLIYHKHAKQLKPNGLGSDLKLLNLRFD